MRQWLVLFVLFDVCCLCHTKVRIFYIAPSASIQIDCSSKHCYSLQDIIRNQSDFVASDTILELLPGTYHIKDKVGNLVINMVSNFILRGSDTSSSSESDSNSNVVSILCQVNATFGLIIRHSQQITISNIAIKHCGAKLTESTVNVVSNFKNTEDPQFCHFIQQWEYVPIPCFGTVFVFFGNGKITIQGTVINDSKGVGVFTYHSHDLSIVSTTITYNLINCMILSPNGNFTLIDSKLMYGQQDRVNLTAGLYILATYPSFALYATNVTFLNNNGSVYFKVHMNMNNAGRFEVVLQHLVIIETKSCISKPGIVIEYEPYYTVPSRKSFHSRIIIFKQSYLTGSCIAVRNKKPLLDHDLKIGFRSITLSESYCASAVTVESTKYLLVKGLSIVRSNYNIFDVVRSNVYFKSTTSFNNNRGTFSVRLSNASFSGLLQVLSNSPIEFESTFVLRQSTVTFLKFKNALFRNNSGTQGGAISAYNSILYFNNTAIAFVKNIADNGGAVSLKEGSMLRLHNNSTLNFYGNQANYYGGGMYVEERDLWSQDLFLKCFAETSAQQYNRIIFMENTAKHGGMSLFGGWIDTCEQTKLLPFFSFPANNSKSNNYTDVSSYPSRVCSCTNSMPNTHKTMIKREIFPGQTFELQVVAVGQRFGVVPAVIKAEAEHNMIIDDLQLLQDVEISCTPVKYTIRSQNREERLRLTIDKRCTSSFLPQQKWLKQIFPELAQLNILILLKNCSLGFVFDSKENSCICHPALLQWGITCNITSQTVNRKAHQWISSMHNTNILIHEHCPLDYCRAEDIFLNLTNPDIQCAYSRSGTLCGICSQGLTQVLGTPNCKVCSNAWLTLIVLFALSGIALVVLLMVLNLTVAIGTINGLIFYANIIRVNTAVFFPRETANTFPSWFIAWINLDFGIETCFYNGLDAYVKTWLQFLFPMYIWFMVIVIIVSSRYFITPGKEAGNNAVQVLATLFLLSFAKLLRVAITIFHATGIHNSNGNMIMVWSYDGTIDYLGKKHIPLFVAAMIVVTVLVLPYMLILLNIRWLQAYSHYQPLFWINKFKPLLDAYIGPYKDKHRYWTGFLLLLRIILFVVFSANISGNPSINLLAVIISATFILTYLAHVRGVYKQWPLNLLEYSFLFNLIILATITLYCQHNICVSKQHFIPWASSTYAFLVTILLFICHIMFRLQEISTVKRFIVFWQKFCKRQNIHSNTDITSSTNNCVQNISEVTQTYVELREPLLL